MSISRSPFSGRASRCICLFELQSRPSCVTAYCKHLAVRNLLLCLLTGGFYTGKKTEYDRNCLCVCIRDVHNAVRPSSPLFRREHARTKQLLFCFPLFNCSRYSDRSKPKGLHWHGQYTPGGKQTLVSFICGCNGSITHL
jgi:hypothetical protein